MNRDNSLKIRDLIASLGLGLVSSPLLAASQLSGATSLLALIGLAPFLLACRRVRPLYAAVVGALVGTAYGVLVSTWIPSALRELGSSPTTSWSGLVLTAAWAKLGMFVSIAILASWLRDARLVVQIMGAALVAGIAEWWIGNWRFGVPFALIGHSQLHTLGTAQLAVVGGVPLLTAWLVAINQAISLAISRRRGAMRIAVAALASWLVAAAIGLPLARLVRPQNSIAAALTVSLLVVQPDIRRRERWIPELQKKHLEAITAFTVAAIADWPSRPDLVVWPENLITHPVDRDDELRLGNALLESVDSLGVPVVTGVARTIEPNAGPGQYRSAVVWIEPRRGDLAVFYKERAIPVLESATWMPGFDTFERLFGSAAQWPKVQEVPGGGALEGRFTLTPALCYEVLFPGLVAARRSEDSVAILNLADDSWVAGDAVTRALTRIARFRAIEQRLTLVRVAHGGLSVVVGPFGEVLDALPLDQWASMLVRVRPMPPPTVREKISLLALPMTTAFAVWWISGWLVRKVHRRDAEETTSS